MRIVIEDTFNPDFCLRLGSEVVAQIEHGTCKSVKVKNPEEHAPYTLVKMYEHFSEKHGVLKVYTKEADECRLYVFCAASAIVYFEN